MNKFFDYYNSSCQRINSSSSFSYDPYLTAIRELFLSVLQQIVYYIEKLKNLDIDMNVYTDKVIEFIAVLIVNLDFNKENFFVIIEDLYDNLKILEKIYVSACEKLNISPEFLNINETNLSSKEFILKALNEKEKNINDINSELKKDRRILYEIMISLVLNSCNYLMALKDLNVDFENAKNQVLKLLNTTNFHSLSDAELILVIKNFSICNYKIMKNLYENTVKKYGPIHQNEVPLSYKKGKSILVSGNNLKDLEKILIAVKGLNINVYTHNEMLKAFQYQRFFNYSNLAGHYQNSDNNFLIDFANFPGPIFISKNLASNLDIIRGQIYTNSKYPSFGIGKIENDDYSPLIHYALESNGFNTDSGSEKIIIGYSQYSIKEKVNYILKKIKNSEINRIFIIGLINKNNSSNQYINEFLKILPENDFVISFFPYSKRENYWQLNSYFDFYAIYNVLELFLDNYYEISSKISVIFLDCNFETISHIFNFIHLNIKNIYVGTCCPSVINPNIIDVLIKLFDVKQITNPNDDLNLK